MAKQRKQAQTPIRLWLKELAGGSKSAYLIYHEHGKRKYECLNMYVIPEYSKEDKQTNQKTMQAINNIMSQRVIEWNNGKAGISKATTRGKMLLKDWMQYFAGIKREQGQSHSNAVTINNTMMHLIAYKGAGIKMLDIDKAFCEGFIKYLATAQTFKGNQAQNTKPLAKSTAKLYFNTFTCALNEAVRNEVMQSNPMSLLSKEHKKPIKANGNTRTYLTLDEVKQLASTDYCNPVVKQLFMFGCFCGLRISDISSLTWGEVRQDGEQVVITKNMKKTGETIVLPLNKFAVSWMPERGNAKANEPVFPYIPANSTINSDLKAWAKQAGIDKQMCFHVSRHTFATGLLTLGADLYTTSKLLGHQNIRTTQVYAEIINQKKTDAVNLFNNIEL